MSSSQIYDAVVVLGGGLDPETAQPHPWVKSRLERALTIQTNYYIALSRGTTHRPPPLDARGHPITESCASAAYLMQRGVPAQKILLDGWSLDTIGNAFFARSMICAPHNLQKLCIITSEFHMPRSRAIFDWVFSMDGAQFSLDYCVAADDGLTGAQLAARKEGEQRSLRTLEEVTKPRVHSLLKLSQFVFEQHGAYSAAGVVKAKNMAVDLEDAAIKKSY